MPYYIHSFRNHITSNHIYIQIKWLGHFRNHITIGHVVGENFKEDYIPRLWEKFIPHNFPQTFERIPNWNFKKVMVWITHQKRTIMKTKKDSVEQYQMWLVSLFFFLIGDSQWELRKNDLNLDRFQLFGCITMISKWSLGIN